MSQRHDFYDINPRHLDIGEVVCQKSGRYLTEATAQHARLSLRRRRGRWVFFGDPIVVMSSEGPTLARVRIREGMTLADARLATALKLKDERNEMRQAQRQRKGRRS
jgi:hypothetical protein